MSDDGRHGQYHFDPATYLEMMLTEVPGYVELQEALVRAAIGVKAALVLELGVGTGETSVRVRAAFPSAHLVGIDESEAMLAQARGRLGHADLRAQRLQDPLPEGTFDLAVSALTVHHLDGAGKADLFRRVAQRLRDGGRFVVADVIVPDDPVDVVTPIDGLYDTPSRVDELLGWLRDAGFEAALTWRHRDLAVLAADL